MREASSKQAEEIRALRHLPDSQIDVSDVPPVADWSKAVVGRFYRPIKKSLTIRIDADVLAWFKAQGKGYQTRINGLLRRAMDDPAGRASSKRNPDAGGARGRNRGRSR